MQNCTLSYRIAVDFILNPSVRGRESVLLSMDAHSIWHDTKYSGDRDKRIEWAERDETMDCRSTSRNTIASASRRIVCLALISAPSSRFFSSLAASSFFPKDHLRTRPLFFLPSIFSFSLSLFSLSLSLSLFSLGIRRRRNPPRN